MEVEGLEGGRDRYRDKPFERRVGKAVDYGTLS